jgi:exonuclease SbcD
MRELRGTYEEVMAVASRAGSGEYVKIVLTDRAMTPEINAHFEALFKAKDSVLMERVSEFQRFTGEARQRELHELEQRSVEELFVDFYTDRANGAPEDEDVSLLRFAAELLRHSDAGEDGKQVPPSLPEKILEYLAKEAEEV